MGDIAHVYVDQGSGEVVRVDLELEEIGEGYSVPFVVHAAEPEDGARG